MPSWTAQRLTKRRAVDFCRVATALCRRSPGRSMRAAH
ncbi:MAG TPA: putative leader peptide [Streptosporangiaceae bacterium]